MNYECFDHGEKNIYLVDMRKELDKHFSELFDKGIRKYLLGKKKIWILEIFRSQINSPKFIGLIFPRQSPILYRYCVFKITSIKVWSPLMIQAMLLVKLIHIS